MYSGNRSADDFEKALAPNMVLDCQSSHNFATFLHRVFRLSEFACVMVIP